MTTTKSYDFLNRLTAIQSGTGVAPVSLSAYAYNAANQRAALANADHSRWVYTYDDLCQMVSGKKYWSDGTPVAGQKFGYGFDDIGNRKNTKAGGDENGSNVQPANYTINTLNQITWVQFLVFGLIQQPASTQPLADEHEQVHPAPREVKGEHDGGPQRERGRRHRHRSDWRSPEPRFHRRCWH